MTAEHPQDTICLTYCPFPFNGRGPSNSCMQIVRHFPGRFADSTLYIPKSRGAPDNVRIVSGLPSSVNFIPWRLAKPYATARTERQFAGRLRRRDADPKIAYFWPSPPPRLLADAKAVGAVSVREMINSYRGTAKIILDQAFDRAGLPPSHTITDASVEAERAELGLYDFVFSSNGEVDASLVAAGVAPSKILKTSFGWVEERFNRLGRVEKRNRFTVVFVGTVGIRKGVLDLLRAWKRAKVDGQLVIIGEVEPHFVPLLKPYEGDPDISFIPFTKDIEKIYKESHVFVFPTYEEGGPQVTYEAAGCGLPSIVTPMGAGRIIEHERNGLVVTAGDIDALAEALARMARDPSLVQALAERARSDASRFAYNNVGPQRADLLKRACLGV